MGVGSREVRAETSCDRLFEFIGFRGERPIARQLRAESVEHGQSLERRCARGGGDAVRREQVLDRRDIGMGDVEPLERAAIETPMRRDRREPGPVRGLLGERSEKRLDRETTLDEVAGIERVGDRLGEKPLVDPLKRALDCVSDPFGLLAEPPCERAVVLGEAPPRGRRADDLDDLGVEAADRGTGGRTRRGIVQGAASANPGRLDQMNQAIAAAPATAIAVSTKAPDRRGEAGEARVTSIGPDQA